MHLQAEPSSDAGCTTPTASADEYSSQSLRNNQWTYHSVIALAQDSKADKISMTPFSQYHQFQARKPEHRIAQYCQHIPINNPTEQTTLPSFHIKLDSPDSTMNSTMKETTPSNFSSINYPHALPSLNSLQDQKDTHQDEVYLSKFLESCSGTQDWSSWSCVDESHDGVTVRFEKNSVGLGSVKPPTISSKQLILEPMKISSMAQTLQTLESEFVASYLRIKEELDKRSEICDQTKELREGYSLTEEGRTHFQIILRSVEHQILTRLQELKQVYLQLDSNFLECKFKTTNEHDCSEIWTKLESVKDHTIILGDAFLKFGASLRQIHSWMMRSLVPTCAKIYSKCKDTQNNPTAGPKQDVVAAPDSLMTAVQGVFNGNATAQKSITFYQNCILSIKISVEGFLKSILEGALSIDELVIWGRLCNLSLGDISRGLNSFLNIAGKIAHEDS